MRLSLNVINDLSDFLIVGLGPCKHTLLLNADAEDLGRGKRGQ